jgi:aryl-alcohol dehydrogenase-like predicted oxidoreductase
VPWQEAKVRYKLLGRSGLRVSELALGAMTFGDDWGWGAGPDECEKMVRAFLEAGGNFIDTANHYTGGSSERILGEIIKPQRERIVLASKYTLNGRPDDPNAGGNQRKSLVQSLEASLKRLGTEYIDLYWVHAWDRFTPTEEVVRALDDVVRAGKVLYVGMSDAPAWVVSQAATLADLRGWSRFVGLQIPYSLIERTVERELLPMAKALDIGVTVWGVLGAGVLTGKYAKGQPKPAGDRLSQGAWGESVLTDRNLAIAAEVRQVAAELDATPSQVAVAWVLAQRARRGVLIPILGVRKLSQLEDNLAALSLELPEAALDRLEAVSRVEMGFPHDFGGLRFVYGNTLGLIDDHRG